MRGAAIVAVAGLGYSAQAAIHAIIDHLPQSQATVARGFDAQDHFPGAALLYAEAPPEAPTGAGMTGTITLPDAPPGVDAAALAATVTPARPFSLAGISALDRGRALDCLASAIYYEAASEPDAGQRAVAQVVLNRVRHPAFPGTVCGVVYQGAEHRGCQFSFACDGALARAPSRAGWARALRTASLMLNGAVEPSVGMATHYHTYAVTPPWNRALVMTAAVGAHFFHRWKGYWGTPAAFAQRYRGGEPLPGPARLFTQQVASTPAPVTRPGPASAPLPVLAASGAPRAAPPPQDRLPESDILPQWRDSGRPLQ